MSGYSVFKYYENKGFQLENMLMLLDKDKYVIDWLEFISTSIKNNWKLKGTLVKIENSLIEVYGIDYSLEVMKRLNYFYKNTG